MRMLVMLCLCLCLAAAACVRAEDLQAWVGQPVSALQSHPIFGAMTAQRVPYSGTVEIWNYKNGYEVTTCEVTVRDRAASSSTYAGTSECVTGFRGCNNFFFVRNGIILEYKPIGSGGAICYTDSSLQPRFYGSTNIK